MKKVKAIKINIFFVCLIVFIFLCIIAKLIYVGSGKIVVNGKSLSEFASDRDTVKRITVAKRGTIYSKDGEILAKDVNSYTVIAYLSPSRTKDINHPYHVVNKEETAEKLSPLINMKKETILGLLNTNIKSCDKDGNCISTAPYQVELGPGGRGISELVKDQIEDLELPGIDFIASTKRYYPNGDFLSYTLGYAKNNDEGVYAGELGVELYYNDELTGENGYIEYQSDIQGYQITSLPNVEQKAISGNDIYLTIDDNIQMFTEQAINIIDESKPEWATISVMNAKTGEILGVASSPSFNNNTLDIKSYYDPFSAYTYEPGSTLKIFSFMAAMENGIYDGKEKYKSGKLKVDDATIKDWNGYGWGEITFDEGFMGSSNVAASKLALKMGRAKLKDFYTSLGFGTKTGISLPNEGNGIINFRYNTEIASASFGQGITVTAVQMLQALSSLGNDGVMIKPYIVSKIVNGDTGEVILENKREEIRRVCSSETANNMIKLMRGVVDGSARMSTGTGYNVKGYDLIGKTGTAEIASSSGGYLKGSSNYVRSFAGLFPQKDPQVVVYVAASKMSSSNYLKTAVKSLVKDVGTYLNINNKETDTSIETYTLDSYINKITTEIVETLENENMQTVVIGDGEKIIDQYPKENTTLNRYNKVFLLTNSTDYRMPNIKGWSRSEINAYAKLINLKVNYIGYGYAKEYSIKSKDKINSDSVLDVVLEEKYKEKEDNKEKKE